MNNADESTPKGAFAYVAPSAKVGAQLGYWTKIGDGARVPASATLGNWSYVGHFAKIGTAVEFGSWASVGIDAAVDGWSKLGSHEYVPSGYRRLRSGRIVRRDWDEADVAIYHAFDSMVPYRGGPRWMTIEEGRIEDQWRHEAAMDVARLLPAFLERRKAMRPIGFLSQLLRLAA